MRHKKLKVKLLSAAGALVIMSVIILALLFYEAPQNKDDTIPDIGIKKETIHLWYTDDALTDYLSSEALKFYENTDIRVEVKLVSGLEYLEMINKSSIDQEEDAPDIYILSNDSLEKAYLAGLAAELSKEAPVYDVGTYNQAALNAVSYDGKYVACPMYFETSALLYNKTYLQQIADEAAGMAEGEDDGEEENQTQSSTPLTVEQLIPSSIADILDFADKYSAPENVEYFFRWDVSDIFYNYFFIGNYISVGGDAGDDKSLIDIYNTESVLSLKVYQELNQFFSIDTKETNYESILQEFQDGKTIYTIATSDCIKRLDEAAANGEFDYEYGIAKLPDINQELSTRGMSVTNALVINGYSEHKKSAEHFMKYMINDTDAVLYQMTGKLPAVRTDEYDDPHMAAFMENYEDSVPVTKMLETSNFWVELETCFARVWDGADANTQIRQLSEQIKTQLAGEPVTEDMIDTPNTTE